MPKPGRVAGDNVVCASYAALLRMFCVLDVKRVRGRGRLKDKALL
jgi:hypothetical protein